MDELTCAFCGTVAADEASPLRSDAATVCKHCLQLCRELVMSGSVDVDDDDDDDDDDDWVYDPAKDDYVRRPAGSKSQPPPAPDTAPTRCSFCGAAANQVKRLIAAEHAFICDGCVLSAPPLED